MRKRFFLIVIAILSGFWTSATLVPKTGSPLSKTIVPPQKITNIASLKIKDIQKMMGRKLSLKENIAVLLLKHDLKHRSKKDNQAGNTALIFGVAGAALFVIGLFVGPLLIGSLIAAIVAVVLGSITKKKNLSDGKARAAAILGWITIGLLAVLILAAAIVVASWGWY